MQKILRSVVLAGLFMASASVVAAGDLKLFLANGRATIVADEVPLRQILAEWARVGKTTIVNGDKLIGPAVTLQLVDVPEQQALETLLRSASGYVVAQRASYMPGASVFDRILIMPTSRPPAVSATAAPPSFNQPPRPMPMPLGGDDDAVDAPVIMPPNMLGPQSNPNVPQMTPAPGNAPQPMTAPRPGMLPPAPGQPGAPPVIKPPGGPGGGPGGAQ